MVSINSITSSVNLPSRNAAKSILVADAPRVAPKKIDGAALKQVAVLNRAANAAQNNLDKVQNQFQRLINIATKALSGVIGNDDRAKLDRQFQAAYSQLKTMVARAGYQGEKLFGGAFTRDASATLGKYINTGAPNQPTAEQASLRIPAILSGNPSFSLLTTQSASESLVGLQAISNNIVYANQDIAAFRASVKFAENNIRGVANNDQPLPIDPEFKEVKLITGTLQQSEAVVLTISSANVTPLFPPQPPASFPNVQLINGNLAPSGVQLLQGSLQPSGSSFTATEGVTITVLPNDVSPLFLPQEPVRFPGVQLIQGSLQPTINPNLIVPVNIVV